MPETSIAIKIDDRYWQHEGKKKEPDGSLGGKLNNENHYGAKPYNKIKIKDEFPNRVFTHEPLRIKPRGLGIVRGNKHYKAQHTHKNKTYDRRNNFNSIHAATPSFPKFPFIIGQGTH